MKPSFKYGDRVELMATIIDPDGKQSRRVVDDRGWIVGQEDDFTYRVKLDGEDEAINCLCYDLQLLNPLDLLAERLDGPADD